MSHEKVTPEMKRKLELEKQGQPVVATSDPELVEQVENLTAVRDQLAEVNTDLQQQIEKLVEEKATLEARVTELDVENTELKARLETLPVEEVSSE